MNTKFRRFRILFLTLAVLLCALLLCTGVSAEQTAGDVNGDGAVNANDAIYTLRHVLFNDQFPVEQSCDFDGDGDVDANDAIQLLRHVLFPDRYPLLECGHGLEACEAKAPTCDAEGNIAYWFCSFCRKCFLDEKGENEIAPSDTVIPAKHTGGTEIRNAKEATAAEDGYTGDTYCLGCGRVVAYGTVIPFCICEDADKDHVCDYGCTRPIGEHSDSPTDDDHVCDYGCGASLEDCSDAENDGDHACDVCGNADISSHSFGNATCGAPATCSECGATTGSTLEHIDENCDHICDNNCGKIDMGNHEDSSTDGDHVCDYGCGLTLEACSDVETDDDHNCDVCNAENVTSHIYVENTALATEATCETAATKTYTCNCGDSYTEEDGDALGHNVTGATPNERLVDGCEYVMVYNCQNGDCDEEVLGETIHRHNYIASISTYATCLTPGEKTFKCSICDDTSKAAEIIPADATGHSWEIGNVENGARTDTCSICEISKTVMVSDSNSASSNASDLANTDVQLKVDDNTNANIQLGQGVADAIGDKDITISAGVVDENTLKDMGVSDEQLDQIGANTVYDFNIKDGNGSSISGFGENNFVTITLPYTLSEGEDIDSIAVWFISDDCQVEDCDKGENCVDAHKLVSIEATYNNGFVTFQTNHFSIYTVTRLTPAQRCNLYGHGYLSQHVEGSCTKDAYDLYMCVRCHDKYIDEDTLVVADGHDYTSETHAATCTEDGYILYSCSDCDHSYRTKLSATGHAWSTVASEDATCVADGYVTYGCDNCDEEYTVTFPRLSHVYTSTIVPATCSSDGYTIYDCDNCDYSYTDAYVEALGHNFETGTWEWIANGNKATFTLACEHDSTHVTIFHVTSNIDKKVEKGTCSNYVKRTHTATVEYNGVTYTDVIVIIQGNPSHDFSADWTKDEQAHWHECICGEKTDVAEHIFENATITKEPTCSEEGEITYYCVCGETNVTTIPATENHNYVDGVCSSCGREEVICNHTIHMVAVDFDEPDACGGSLIVFRCDVCGQIFETLDFEAVCNVDLENAPVTEEVTDENGTVHRIQRVECPDCDLVFTIDTAVQEISVCERNVHIVKTVTYGETTVVEVGNSYHESTHEYEYTYELQGETCEAGYYVNQNCPRCGSSNRYQNYGHRREWREIDLAELGLCGGRIRERYCVVCDTVYNSYFETSACSWEYVGNNADGYQVYECSECGATWVDGYRDSEKDENCQYVRTTVKIFIVNGEEVYGSEWSTTHTKHRYEYEFVTNGESCKDGYTVTITCEDCDYIRPRTGNNHDAYNVFTLDDRYECCDGHYLNVHCCPCGYEYNFNFDEYNFIYDEEQQMYVCENCDLAVAYNVDDVEEGCTLIQTTTAVVKIADEVVCNYEKVKTYENHSFTDVETTLTGGENCITISCDKCDAVYNIEILSAELEQHGDEYYYDYTFTPDESATYSITSLSDRDTYVTLYRVEGDNLVQIGRDDNGGGNAQFCLHADLTAGTTYVYRIRFYNASNSGSISFILQGTLTEKECRHNAWAEFSALLDGSTTCEDGAVYGRVYTDCGCIRYVVVENQHRMIQKNIGDLAGDGACHGKIMSRACACGQKQEVYLSNICADTWTDNEYYDEQGRLVYVEARTCSECGLRYTRSYYTVKDHENCTLTYYYTVVVNVGANLVAEVEYTSAEVDHDWEITGTLTGGEGSTCEDGVVITYRCKDCELENVYNSNYHETYAKERIDLSELGSVCGGYATVYGCACGKNGHLDLNHSLCEWGDEWCECWIENAINEHQYSINGGYGFSSYADLYICAVTDPEDAACAYKIRYAYYWLKDANSCMAYRYETWQFGYNEETGTYAYEVTFKTGNSRIYHNYVADIADNHTKYDCPDCGSYYYVNNYYDEDGNRIKNEQIVSNTLDNGYDKYRETVKEYATAEGRSYTSRIYQKRIYSDGSEYWSEELREEEGYVGTFGESGRRRISSYTDSKGESYSEDYAYVLYKGFEFPIYTYRIEGDYWYRYDYTYTFDNGCVNQEVYTDSDGAREENTYDICRFWNTVTIKAPTCTQEGEAYDKCVVCDKQTESYVRSPHDHNWVQVTDNWHYCFTCGLENANGVSGDIIMEDMTETYGNGEYYVVGYYARNNVEFSQYISLILADADRTEVVIPSGIDFVTIDGIRAFAFSKAAVDAWATENGYTDYDVRFSFVPVGSDGSFDYGITFAEPMVATDTISDNVSFTDYIGEGETKSYTITPTEDGVWTFTSRSNSDPYGYLFDADGKELIRNDDGGVGGNFKITYELKAGETYVVKVRWYSSSRAGNVALLFGWEAVTAE